jgi:cytochrome c biogenesis protein CcmG/thiol:disulfide interchange protein DsbE
VAFLLGAGNSAPDFSGTDIVGGGTFTLSDHLGKVICLAMSAYWCPHCTNELTRLQSLWAKYQGHGVQMVAVHVDPNQTAAQTWLAGMGITFPVVQDNASNTIFNSYATGTGGIPQLYIIDRNQIIHSSHLGEETESVIEGHILDAIYTREPVDIEMVMDVSDSMNSAPTSGDSKLIMMKQASQMVVDFLRDHGQTSDRMGLVWFTDDVSEYTNSIGQKLLPILSNWSDLKNQIDAQGTGICTAMGAGLQKAFDTLSSSTQKRFTILLTDGMQNIEPKLTQVSSHYEIIDSGGWLCGGHSSIPPHPGVDITSYNTTIHTIGVGITATYASLLQDIANATNGFYLGTNDPAFDLDLIYFVHLCNCLAGGSPSIVYHNSGTYYLQECRTIEKFLINRSVRKITVILSWEKALAGALTFWLRTPDGLILDLHQEMKLYGSYCMATVYLPKEQNGTLLQHIGEWEMIISGVTSELAASYHTLIIAEDNESHLELSYPRKVYEVGDILPLHIYIEEAGAIVVQPNELIIEKAILPVPISELLAKYKITPYAQLKQIKATRKTFELDPLEIKLEVLASSPQFQKLLQPVRKKFSLKEGTLNCEITENDIIIPISLTAPGLNTFRVISYFETKKNGPIQRVTMVSIHVEPGKVNPKRSIVKVIPILKDKRKGALVYVTPRNTAGHLLGPGHCNEFKIYFGKTKVEYRIDDQLDGTYRLEILPKRKLPRKGQAVKIMFRDKPFWTGIIRE